MQEQAELVGPGLVTGGAVRDKVVLPRLDMVLGLAAGAIQPFIELLGAAAFKVGDDVACIASLWPGFDPRDDALDPAPTFSGVIKLHVAPNLAAIGRGLEALRRGLFQRRDMPVQRAVGSQDRKSTRRTPVTPI